MKPSVRVTNDGKALLIDDLNTYAGELIGGPPEGFNQYLEAARRVAETVYKTLDLDPLLERDDAATRRLTEEVRDVLMLAAFGFAQRANKGHGENEIAFVQQAKRIARWCRRPLAEHTPLEFLEAKARELTEAIGKRLFPSEGFTLILYNLGEGGHTTWISSSQRRDTIKLIRDLVGHMEEDQARQS